GRGQRRFDVRTFTTVDGRQRGDDARGAENRVLLTWCGLVAEPERHERPVRLLGTAKIVDRAVGGAVDAGPQRRCEPVAPRQPGADRMSREVGAAAIEGERAPAA